MLATPIFLLVLHVVDTQASAEMQVLKSNQRGQSLFSGLDHWTGLLDWNTGLAFDPRNSIQKTSISPL